MDDLRGRGGGGGGQAVAGDVDDVDERCCDWMTFEGAAAAAAAAGGERRKRETDERKGRKKRGATEGRGRITNPNTLFFFNLYEEPFFFLKQTLAV